MSEFGNPTIDINLQMRVQIALDQWAQCKHFQNDERVFAAANNRGEVILRGRVYGRMSYEEAANTAQMVPGVKIIFNQIAIGRLPHTAVLDPDTVRVR